MKQTYPTLYSRDSSKNIRIWYMEQDGANYRTISGIQNGQLVTTEYTVAQGKNIGKKNETSGIEQAAAEIESKYKKQLKTGYFEDIKDVDNDYGFLPMLAKDYDDYKDKIDWSEGVGVQIKFNGGRMIARKEGLFTRTNEKYLSVPHIEEELAPFFKKYPDAVLDGEAFNYERRERLNEIMEILRRTVHFTPDHFKRSKELIQFYVYDGGGFADVKFEDNYKIRKYRLDQYLEPHFKSNILQLVQTHFVFSEKELEKLYQSFLKENHEGAILRLPGPYQNKRSKLLLKYKPVNDAECIILDIMEGEGNWAGTGKIISIKWNNEIFNATFKGAHEEAAQFLKDKKKWIGKEVTFLYNGLTGKGIPNYARIDYSNCLKK